VLCLYDITDQETIAEIPEVLRESPFHILALYRE
jgi:hypothetical protein